MLTRLKISGFKNLVGVDVQFGSFTCIAGANGVGKSNLFDAIQLLSLLADNTLIEGALSVRRSEGGRTTDVRSLFHRVGNKYDDIMSFEVEMIIPKEGVDDLGQQAEAAITFLRYKISLTYEENETLPSIRILADATNTIAEGEVLQLMNCHDPDVDEARYLDVVRRKTAKLFEASARLGGVLGGASAALEDGLARYGMHLGTAFQVVDDVLDYSGAAQETGKSLGDDLAEGKPTLPLIRAMQAGSAAQRDLVRRAILEGGREDFAPVLDAIKSTGALDYAQAAAAREAETAAQAIAGLPASACRDSLLELAAFSVTRRG
jgi:octaprenyl-diphosphate synthase